MNFNFLLLFNLSKLLSFKVDIDAELLIAHQQKAVPLIADYLKKRERPLHIDVLQGSIADALEQLYDVDVVIGLEM